MHIWISSVNHLRQYIHLSQSIFIPGNRCKPPVTTHLMWTSSLDFHLLSVGCSVDSRFKFWLDPHLMFVQFPCVVCIRLSFACHLILLDCPWILIHWILIALIGFSFGRPWILIGSSSLLSPQQHGISLIESAIVFTLWELPLNLQSLWQHAGMDA